MKQSALFEMAVTKPHCAKYTDALLPVMAEMLKGSKRILDPFGGTGKIFQLTKYGVSADIYSVEIEPEWANCHPSTLQGNALKLPYEDGHFCAICTSPTYGNRMADTYLPPEDSPHHYNTYTYQLGRKLNPENSGSMQWGDAYREFHIKAWAQARRVLKDEGIFILNIKDHIRGGKRQNVTGWHVKTLKSLGFYELRHEKISCPNLSEGENGDKRIPYESVILFGLAVTS